MREDIILVILRVCSAEKRLLGPYVKSPWLQILDGYSTLERCCDDVDIHGNSLPYSTGMSIWKQFGALLGFREDEVRRELASGTSANTGALMGCSWVRCPLYEEVGYLPGREPMRCSRCRMVRLVSRVSEV